MDKYYAALIVICVTLYGLLKTVRGLRYINEIHAFNGEFLKKLQDYVKSEGRDYKAYTWLTKKSNKMQDVLGRQGILTGYKPPHQSIMYKNYPIILNMLPDLRVAIENEILSHNLAPQYANTLSGSINSTYWQFGGV